jgi:hypothetical protein
VAPLSILPAAWCAARIQGAYQKSGMIFDNGKEFAMHELLGVKSYFAIPITHGKGDSTKTPTA